MPSRYGMEPGELRQDGRGLPPEEIQRPPRARPRRDQETLERRKISGQILDPEERFIVDLNRQVLEVFDEQDFRRVAVGLVAEGVFGIELRDEEGSAFLTAGGPDSLSALAVNTGTLTVDEIVRVYDNQDPPELRVLLGMLGPEVEDWGIEVYDAAGNAILTADGLGTDVVGSGQVQNGAISTPHVQAGAIDTNELAADAVIADIIAANAVQAQHIASYTMEVGKYIQSSNFVSGESGWRIDHDAAEFNHVVVRGTLVGVDGTFLGEVQSDTFTASKAKFSESLQVGANINTFTQTPDLLRFGSSENLVVNATETQISTTETSGALRVEYKGTQIGRFFYVEDEQDGDTRGIVSEGRIVAEGEMIMEGDLEHRGSMVGFFGATPALKGEAGTLEELLALLDTYGLITDSSTG